MWLIAVLKFLQTARLRARRTSVRARGQGASGGQELYAAAVIAPELAGRAHRHGARVALAGASPERLRAIAERALVDERARATTLMSTLGSIAAASPFIGLFGTVYGIMDALHSHRSGEERVASRWWRRPSARRCITTAIGLAAAIPAVMFYNAIDKRVSDLLDEIEASVSEWVLVFSRAPAEVRSRSPARSRIRRRRRRRVGQ